jgi:uncharacterized protein YfaS (alpha-2-macroglobulin family)
MGKEDNFLAVISFAVFFLSVFLAVSLSSPQQTIIEKEPSPTSLLPDSVEERVLGQRTRAIYIYGGGEESGEGVIALSSTDEPAVRITSYDLAGEAEVTLYRVSEQNLLDYLVHNEKGFQIEKKPPVDQFEKITTISHPILGGGKESKLLLPLEEKGIWFLEIKLGGIKTDVFVIRSGIGAIAKEGDNEYIFWAQSFKTKRSLSEGTIQIYNLLNQPRQLASAALNEEGIARAPLLSEADMAILRQGEEMAIIPLNLRYLNSEYLYQPFQPKSQETKYFVFTDRPLYKPGDKVYFKAVIRDDNDARYTIPTGSARMEIYKGARGDNNILFKKTYEISPQGTIWGEYQLPEEAIPGYYTLLVEMPSKEGDYRRSTTSFQVEYFRKPEYSIEINAPQTELIAQDKASFKISGRYFFGQPLANQKVKYTIWSGDFYEYQYQTEFPVFLSDEYRWGYWGGTKLLEEEVVLNAKGEAEINLDTSYPGKIGKPQVFSVEAEFDDGSGNPSFARKNLLIYPGEYTFYRRTAETTVQVGTPLNLSLILEPRREGQVNTIPLTAKVHRTNWVPYQEEGKKYPSYQKEEEDLPELKAASNAQGEVNFSLVPSKPGSYNFTVSGSDRRGNLISKDFSFWVVGKDQPIYEGYAGDNQQKLTIKADKLTYSPAEKVRLTIFSEVPDRDIFLSFERGWVHRFQVVKISGKSETIEVPLVESDMPNIFANALSFADDGLDYASVDIKVPAESKRMVVSITPDKETYAPGETLTLNLQTNDFAGNPVAAELAVWAVDKALFELVDKKPAEIFREFWQERSNTTAMAHSLEGFYNMGGPEMGGGGGSTRDIFEDTAYWNPVVQTGNDGRAQISFKLPDNLTTWVISALGATADTKAGQSTSEVVVSKEVVIRPVLPNILREGDQIFLSALVQNFTEKEEVLEVRMKFEAGKVSPKEAQTISLKPQEIKQIYWQVSPDEEKEKAKLTFSAGSSEDKSVSDEVVVEIPVYSFGFWEKSAFAGEGPKTFSVKLSPDRDQEKSAVSLSLSPSLMGMLPTAMEYLINYPYGCAEQVASRLAPAVIAKENPQLFVSQNLEKGPEQVIKESIKKLVLLQHDDGGWSWWKEGSSNPFITAYVVEYLLRAKQAGGRIDEEVFKKAKAYLEGDSYYDFQENISREYSREDWIAKTYALSLIGSEKGKKFLTDLDNLGPDYLALALMSNLRNGNKDPQSNGLAKLLALARYQGEAVFWEEGEEKNFGSKEVSTALALRAITSSGEHRDVATKAARFLARNRKFDYWANTFATAQVVQALVDFGQSNQETSPDYTYRVLLNNQEISRGNISDLKQEIAEIKIPLKEVKNNNLELTIEKEGEGELYSTLIANEFRTERKAEAKNNGLWVKREYISEKGEGYPLVVGETVIVKITVGGLNTEEHYAVIEDQLPAGLIPVNPKFESEQYGERSSYYTSYDVSDQEVSEDGVVLALYRLAPGERSYTYKARVVSAGTFIVPPASASLMYAPEINGRSEVGEVEILSPSELVFSPGDGTRGNFFVRIRQAILNFIQKVLSFIKTRG